MTTTNQTDNTTTEAARTILSLDDTGNDWYHVVREDVIRDGCREVVYSGSDRAFCELLIRAVNSVSTSAAPTVDEMWEALKAACCKNPTDAKLAVFVSEKKFKEALGPFADASVDQPGWVTFGRVKVDIENETETFERIYPPAAASLAAPQFAIEICDLEHRYAFIVGEPKPRCPFCLAIGLDKARSVEAEFNAAPQDEAGIDDYVAWLRYDFTNEETTGATIRVCASDAKGAFKVYRAPVVTEEPTVAAHADGERK